MKKEIIAIGIMILTFGCSKKDEVQQCDTIVESCIVKSISIAYAKGGILEKSVFVHDGCHYSEMKKFLTSQDGVFSDQPNYTMRFFYRDGKLAERYLTQDSYTRKETFTYNGNQVTHNTYDQPGLFGKLKSSVNELYVASSQDGTYEIDNEIFIFKDGNLIRHGYKGNSSSNTLWYSMTYDNLPNLTKHIAFRVALGEIFQEGVARNFSTNNITSVTIEDTPPVTLYYTSTMFNDKYIKTLTNSFPGQTFTFEYDCK